LITNRRVCNIADVTSVTTTYYLPWICCARCGFSDGCDGDGAELLMRGWRSSFGNGSASKCWRGIVCLRRDGIVTPCYRWSAGTRSPVPVPSWTPSNAYPTPPWDGYLATTLQRRTPHSQD